MMCIFQSFAAIKTYKIYHDSDYANHGESARSINMGFTTALAQYSAEFPDYRFEIIQKDHRGNSNRSRLHMKQFLADPDALIMLGGLHSPPYIKYKDFINQNKIPLLVPWAAGGPITRASSNENWIFRLSVDDTKAGFRIVDFAQKQLNCSKPHLLLEDTPWGKSNQKTMTKALENSDKPSITWFNWGTKLNTAKIQLREIKQQNANCILFVGNAVEGRVFFEAMASLPKKNRLPIVSHWGITGGNFFEASKAFLFNDISLHFIQSCFSLRTKPHSQFTTKAVNTAKKLYPDVFDNVDALRAPAGFIHSYDLARLFIDAFKQVDPDADIMLARKQLHHGLENLKQPIQGLIKTYQRPFTAWQSDNPDAHEALGLSDLCMANYEQDGGISVRVN